MIARLSKRMASFFVCNRIIKSEDAEVYEYGLQLLLSTVLNTAIALMIAIVSKAIIPCVFYLSSFVIMRKLAGGFHAKTHLGCCLILIVVLIGFIGFIKIAPTDIYILTSIISIAFSNITVVILAPLEHQNKPLKSKDKIRLRKLSLICIIVLSILAILLGVIGFNRLMLSVTFGTSTASISIIAGKIEKA